MEQAFARIKEAARNGKDESQDMRSAICACMVRLRKIGIAPTSSEIWTDVSGDAREELAVDGNQFTRRLMQDNFTDRFTTVMWSNVIKGEATGGVKHGTPCFGTAKKCH